MRGFQRRELRQMADRAPSSNLPERTGPKVASRDAWDALDPEARYALYVELAGELSQSMGRELMGAAFGEVCRERLGRIQFQQLAAVAHKRAEAVIDRLTKRGQG